MITDTRQGPSALAFPLLPSAIGNHKCKYEVKTTRSQQQRKQKINAIPRSFIPTKRRGQLCSDANEQDQGPIARAPQQAYFKS
jgi:hypothetical protein